MIDNLMFNNFFVKNNLYEWIFNLYKKTQFTYLLLIFGFVNDGDPQSSSKNPIRRYWSWKEGEDSLDTLYNHVKEFEDEAKRINKQFAAVSLEDDEAGNFKVTLSTKQLISVASERDRLKIAKDGDPVPPVDIPEKCQFPLNCGVK